MIPAASAIAATSRARKMPPDFMILMLTRSAISPRTISTASAGLNTLSSAMIGVSIARVIAAIAARWSRLTGCSTKVGRNASTSLIRPIAFQGSSPWL